MRCLSTNWDDVYPPIRAISFHRFVWYLSNNSCNKCPTICVVSSTNSLGVRSLISVVLNHQFVQYLPSICAMSVHKFLQYPSTNSWGVCPPILVVSKHQFVQYRPSIWMVPVYNSVQCLYTNSCDARSPPPCAMWFMLCALHLVSRLDEKLVIVHLVIAILVSWAACLADLKPCMWQDISLVMRVYVFERCVTNYAIIGKRWLLELYNLQASGFSVKRTPLNHFHLIMNW